jgi:nucleoside triphosphate diphosphatase
MAEERGAFGFADVVDAITRKLIRRHPHVFGEARDLAADDVKVLWETIKRQEKAERAAARAAGDLDVSQETGLLSAVPATLPALSRAQKLTARAAKVGFDWPEARQVIEKVREELGEVEDAMASGDGDRMEDEIGDLLFAVTNLARHLRVDPESALRRTNLKFERRFRTIETTLEAQGRSPLDASLDEMERLWIAAKAAERELG